MKYVTLIPVCVIAGLAGCGGGSGSSPEQENTKSAASVFKSSALSSAIASSISSEKDQRTGYFKDASVIGIPYIACNESKTKCIEGNTGMDGSYLYREGYTVRFYLGDLQILSTEAKSLITPLNSVKNQAQAEQLAQILLSLDSDSDPSNGLDISVAAKNISRNTSVGITNVVNATPEQIAHAISVIKPEANIVESSVASQHLEASKRLEADNARESSISQWILNKKALGSNVNSTLLSQNTDARLRYGLWLQYAPFFLAKTGNDLNASISSIELSKKASDSVFKGLEMAMDAVSVHSAVKALKAADPELLIKQLKLAEDGGNLLIDFLFLGKEVQVLVSPNAKEFDKQTESYLRAALSSLTGNPINSAANGLKGLAEGNEGGELAIKITQQVLNNVNDSLKKNDWKFTNNFKLSPSQLISVASSVQTLLDADLLYQDTAYAQARISAFAYLNAYYASGGDMVWMEKNGKIDPSYIERKASEISRVPVSGDIMASTLIESAIAHAQDHIESNYDAVVAFYGGSLDTVNASFESGNADEVVCKNSTLIETINIQRSQNVYKTPTDYAIHWEIPKSISAITAGNAASLRFTERGVFRITTYVARTPDSVPKVMTKFFEVRDCTNSGSSKYSSSASSMRSSSKAASSSANVSSSKSSAVASSSQKVQIDSLSHGTNILRTEDTYTFTAKLTGPASRVTIQFDAANGDAFEMVSGDNYNWTRDRIFESPGKKSITVIAYDKSGNQIASRPFEKTVVAQPISIEDISHSPATVTTSNNAVFTVVTKGKPARVRIRYDKNQENYFDMVADGVNQWVSSRKFNSTGEKEITVQAYNSNGDLKSSAIYELTVK